MPQIVLDPSRLVTLAAISFYFCGIFLTLSLMAAVLLQASQEAFRKVFNKHIVRKWLSGRTQRIQLEEVFDPRAAIGSELFSLPYWQLTGQIGAVAGAKLNADPASKLVLVLANTSDAETIALQAISERERSPREGRDPRDLADPLLLRDLAARTQAGINSLHAHLRSWWNIFDYWGAGVIFLFIVILLTTVQETQGQRFLLYTICFFAWFATPIIRRMIERLVPFR